MSSYNNGDMTVAKDGTTGMVVDGSIFWADGLARTDNDIQFIIRYTEQGAELMGYNDEAILPDLEIGARGLAVVLAQTALQCKEYYKGKIDGDFGKQTYDAVRRFREDNYLSGDTVVDYECYKYLFKE